MKAVLRVLLPVLGVAAVCAALVAWFLHTHERVERKLPLPPHGEAAWNPLYALRQTLRADGVHAQSRQRLQPALFTAAPGDTVLLDLDPARLRGDEVDTLLAWVARGGHLLLRAPAADDAKAELSPVPPILHRLGVTALAPAHCAALQVAAGEPPRQAFCQGPRLLLEHTTPRQAWGDAQPGLAFVRLAHGHGTVDVVADFRLLGNAQLEDATAQRLARRLLAPNYGRGNVHLVFDTWTDPLWWRLLRDGWPLWLPLALLLAGWLWRRAQCFGPWLPSPLEARRSLLEHVRASGALLLRHGQAPLLHEAVRDAFLARLRRRDPAIAALSGEARVQALAARLQFPHSLVRDALARGGLHDRTTYFARVRTLIQMRNRL